MLTENYDEMSLSSLCDHIVTVHHVYVKRAIPSIKEHIDKVEDKDQETCNHIRKVKKEFQQISKDMMNHMEKEEKVLFRIVKYLEDCQKYKERPKTKSYGSMERLINPLEAEHSNAGRIMLDIRNLTNNYTSFRNDDNNIVEIYEELQKFENDLRIHVHLEDEILFPKTIKLEKVLSKTKR
ncbi:MAG: hypothetical protein GY936_10005 [Ignavibacteriae bacterium]|nr:hypothetical protein [Ignavibacteriota bacterium]